MRRALRTAALAALLAPPARAAFDDLGAGARASGMADAFVAVADDVYAVHYNAAGLATLSRPQFGTSYTKLLMGLGDGSDLSDSFIGYAHPLAEGRRGTAAVAWRSFALDSSLYREQTLYLAYGRALPFALPRGQLSAGLALKYLDSSFGSFPESSNALIAGGLQRSGSADPVLAGRRGSRAVDSDLGLLYQLGAHYAVGFQAMHLNRPDVGSGSADRLPTAAKLGFDYRSLISHLTLQVDMRPSPSGGSDKIFSAGAERWFPRLLAGEFGARGGLSLGSRGARQLSAGLSMRARRLGVDYGLTLPLGIIDSSAGSHRVALTFRFGRPSEREESLETVLEAMRQLKLGSRPTVQAQAGDLPSTQRAAFEEYVAQARFHDGEARYEEARKALERAMAIAPADAGLAGRYARESFIARLIPQLADHKTDPAASAVHKAIMDYLGGKDAEAVRGVSYALSLRPEDARISSLLAQLELATGHKRLELAPAAAKERDLASLMTKADAALSDGDSEAAARLSREALALDPGHAAAWQNLGTASLALGDVEGSRQAWQNAYDLEKSPAIRGVIKGYLKSLSSNAARKAAAKPPAPAAAPAPIPPAERRRLFDEGVNHYVARRFKDAREIFERLLRADPSDVEAANALRRVKDEMK